MTKKYGLIGAAGYIAPRHMTAIKETGGVLDVAYDINDSVGILDRHFPDASFFTEFEQFAAYVDAERGAGRGLDYVAICSPNYLHKAHMEFALRSGANVICEKPLVLSPADLEALVALEAETDLRVNSILQLRLHRAIIALKAEIDAGPSEKVHDVDLTYITSRGAWYHASWKGALEKSGGVATNIGVHLFDLLAFLFGELRHSVVHCHTNYTAAGYLEFARARVRWVLSVDREHLPHHTPEGQTTYRSITVDGKEVEFSAGFTDLHTDSYNHVLSGEGFGLEVVRPSIELVSSLRTAPLSPDEGEQHPMLAKILNRCSGRASDDE